MRIFSLNKTNVIRVLLVAMGFSEAGLAAAHEAEQHTVSGMPMTQAPECIAVNSELPPPAPGVTDLKFRDIFNVPASPGRLQPSEKLLGLDGQRVRIVGYMARQEPPSAGAFILSPVPATMGVEDEMFSEDLPSSVIFVHLEGSGSAVPFIPGLLKLTGVLSVGSQAEVDGRASIVRLLLDPALSKEVIKGRSRHASI